MFRAKFQKKKIARWLGAIVKIGSGSTFVVRYRRRFRKLKSMRTWHVGNAQCVHDQNSTHREGASRLGGALNGLRRHRCGQRADDGGVIATDGELEAVKVAEPVERVTAILCFGKLAITLADRGNEIADAAADDEAVVVAEVVDAEQGDAEGAGLVVEEFLRERIAGGDELAQALGFVECRALNAVE